MSSDPGTPIVVGSKAAAYRQKPKTVSISLPNGTTETWQNFHLYKPRDQSVHCISCGRDSVWVHHDVVICLHCDLSFVWSTQAISASPAIQRRADAIRDRVSRVR